MRAAPQAGARGHRLRSRVPPRTAWVARFPLRRGVPVGGAGNGAPSHPQAGGPDSAAAAPSVRWRRAGRRRLVASFPAPLGWLRRSSHGGAGLFARPETRDRGGAAAPEAGRRHRARRDRGVASLEYLGMLPFLLLIALAGIQLGLVAYCGEQAGTAARTAARTASLPDPHGGEAAGAAAGENAVSGWLDATVNFQSDAPADAYKARAKVDIPSVLPGVNLFGSVSRTATMPREDTTP